MDGSDGHDNIRFRCLRPDEVAGAWPYLEPYIAKAVDSAHGLWTIADVKAKVFQRNFMLWTAFRPGNPPDVLGAWTIEKNEYPTCSTLVVHFLGGVDFDLWGPRGNQLMEDLARLWGCKGIEFVGRDGWVRKLLPLGYKSLWRTYFKEV